MLRLELVSDTKEGAVYSYFPEGKDKDGTVSVNKGTGELDIKKIAENDEHKRYLLHAMSRIRKFISENKYPEKETVAWC